MRLGIGDQKGHTHDPTSPNDASKPPSWADKLKDNKGHAHHLTPPSKPPVYAVRPPLYAVKPSTYKVKPSLNERIMGGN